jgi:DNA-nicking Smr family endonuclease
MSGGGKKRGLTGEDRALWSEIAKSIRPLPGRRTKIGDEPEALSVEDQTAKGGERRNRPVPVAPKRREPAPPALAPIDRRLKQRLSRGSAGIDARLDLHGYTQAEAKVRLHRFLEGAQTREHALVLVITGKGKRNSDSWAQEGGVLKRQVPLWLAMPEFRQLVVGFEESAQQHGGAGALYVRVRKRR